MQEIAKQLQSLLGPQGCLDDPNDIAAYTSDLLALKTAAPVCVVRPATTSQVASIVQYARKNKLAIIPQGGHTGLSGGAVALNNRDEDKDKNKDNVILSLDRMTAIREIDTNDNVMIVEAGAVLANVQTAAREAGRIFPLSHGGEASSQIGGNLSTNSGGNNALRYGTARDQVLGIEVVLPSGEIWNGLRRLRKNTAGYDLKHLFMGAEGTLGIITAAALKLRPAPSYRETAFVALAHPQAGLEFLRLLQSHVGEAVTAFELLSDNAISAALTLSRVRFPLQARYPWCALIEADTPSSHFDISGAIEDVLSGALEDGMLLDAVIAQSETQRDEFWHLRESIAFAMIEDKSALKSDTAVPVAKVAEFISCAEAVILQIVPGARCVPFGHLGDGNIHFNVQRPEDMFGDTFKNHWPDLIDAIAKVSLSLGGTISAEHGIGRTKQRIFSKTSAEVELKLMRALKAAIDPDELMNPGAIF